MQTKKRIKCYKCGKRETYDPEIHQEKISRQGKKYYVCNLTRTEVRELATKAKMREYFKSVEYRESCGRAWGRRLGKMVEWKANFIDELLKKE